MSVEQKLAELHERRARFKTFSAEVEADLNRQREERLAAEKAAILQLVLECAAEDASMGQIKRAYNTTDHRTISRMIKEHQPEVAAIRASKISPALREQDWFTVDGDTVRVVDGENVATFEWSVLENGEFFFISHDSRWDSTFTHENTAVSILDGKTESESIHARSVAQHIRALRGDE